MKEELEKIGLSLRAWCLKYNKYYVSMFVLNGNISANLDTKDKDAKELEVAIRDLISNKEKSQKMGNAGRDYVVNNFNFEIFKNKYIENRLKLMDEKE